jgi:hypothetical protein
MHFIEHMGTAYRPTAHTLEVDIGCDSTPSRMMSIHHSLLVSEAALPHITTFGRDGPGAMECGNAVVVNKQVESFTDDLRFVASLCFVTTLSFINDVTWFDGSMESTMDVHAWIMAPSTTLMVAVHDIIFFDKIICQVLLKYSANNYRPFYRTKNIC